MADILLVEDSNEIADLIGSLLGFEGHRVRRARDGIEALKLMEERYPQLVVTDIEMPHLDGKRMVFRMFVENMGRENIPVILISATPDLRSVASAIGTPYFLAKPFNFDRLADIVNRALREAVPPRPPILKV